MLSFQCNFVSPSIRKVGVCVPPLEPRCVCDYFERDTVLLLRLDHKRWYGSSLGHPLLELSQQTIRKPSKPQRYTIHRCSEWGTSWRATLTARHVSGWGFNSQLSCHTQTWRSSHCGPRKAIFPVLVLNSWCTESLSIIKQWLFNHQVLRLFVMP